MNSIFSIDEFSDPFWESPPPLDSDSTKLVTAEEVSQSQPEWTFEMFFEEISSSAVSSEPLGGTNAIIGVSSVQSLPSVSGQNDFEDDIRFRRDHDRDSGNWDSAALPTTVIDSNDYHHRVLKNKLENECATVVALRVGSVKPEDSTNSPEPQFQPAQSSPLPQGSLMARGKLGVTSSLPVELKKTGAIMKQVISGSSREYSDNEDLDEENETTGSLNPEDVKKSRRMLSNRESARRSRRRKQEQTSDLETQVNELKGEHSTLLKQLSNMNHKYDEAAVGNRILKADIETLRAKVKMAEETVKRVTGMNPMLLGRSNGHNNNKMPLTGNNRINSSCIIPPFQPQSNLNHIPNPNIGIPTILPSRLGNNYVPPPSVNSQSNSQLQRIRNGHNHHIPPSTNPYSWTNEPQNDSAEKCGLMKQEAGFILYMSINVSTSVIPITEWRSVSNGNLMKNNRVLIEALYPIVKESFQIYYNVTEIMGVLIDRFMEFDVPDSSKVYDIFCRVSKQYDELDPFYRWCKNMGVARSSEFPELEKITQKKLDLMEEFIRDKSVLAA